VGRYTYPKRASDPVHANRVSCSRRRLQLKETLFQRLAILYGVAQPIVVCRINEPILQLLFWNEFPVHFFSVWAIA
jgi:hypothetical protein